MKSQKITKISSSKFSAWLLVLCASSISLGASPSAITYQGRLTNASGTAITDSSVAIKFRILNSAADCILYSETQTINTSATSGLISVEVGSEVGSGKRNTEDRGNTMAAIFSNNGTAIPGKQLVSPATNCVSDYTPATTDDRKMAIVIVSTSTNPTLNLALSPVQTISAVPYATVAQTLNGYTSSQFLRLSGTAAAPTARVTAGNVNTLMDRLFTTQATGYDRLDDILTNWGSNISVSSNNFNVNSNKITNLATPTAGTDAANKNYCDGSVGGQATSGLGALAGGDSGKALVWNGTNWVAQTINALPAQATHSGKYLTTDGTNASWNTISLLPAQATHSGKFLTTDGTNASWASTGTVTSATATAPLEISGTATTAPNVRFVAGTALNDSYVLTITNGNQPAFVNSGGLYVLKGGQTGALSLGTTDATNLTFLTNNIARVTVKSDGNVGIGTTNPTSKLEVVTNALGTTQTNTSGLALINETAAASGSQQISPAVRWRGQGWATSPTDSSVPIDFRSFVVPVEGDLSTVGGYLTFQSTTNNGAYSDRMVISHSGKVGIGTANPASGSKLDVNGAIKGALVSVANPAGTGIDLSAGNIQYTGVSCAGATWTISNMVEGTTYTIVVQGAAHSGLCAFSDGSSTVKYQPANTQPTSDAIYSIMKVGSVIYVSWIDGW